MSKISLSVHRPSSLPSFVWLSITSNTEPPRETRETIIIDERARARGQREREKERVFDRISSYLIAAWKRRDTRNNPGQFPRYTPLISRRSQLLCSRSIIIRRRDIPVELRFRALARGTCGQIRSGQNSRNCRNCGGGWPAAATRREEEEEGTKGEDWRAPDQRRALP